MHRSVGNAPRVVGSSQFLPAFHLLVLVSLVSVITLHVPVAKPLTDAFQEAEYAVIGPLLKNYPGHPMPILIHGGMDVLPSGIAAAQCPPDTQIVCVRTIDMAIQLATSLMFVAVLALLAGLGSLAALAATGPAIAMLWLFDGPTAAVADAVQGAPGTRDLFIMAALLLMARSARRLQHGRPDSTPDLLALGALAATGLFWAYNRGLVLAPVAALFTLLLCRIRRRVRPALLVALGVLAAAAALAAIYGVSLFDETQRNIRYWGQNGALWRQPLRLRTITPTILFDLVAAALALPAAWAAGSTSQPGRPLMVAVLLGTTGLYFMQALNRSDALHMHQALWPAALLLAVGIRTQFDAMTPTPAPNADARAKPLVVASLIAASLLAGLCLETLSGNSIANGIIQGLAENIRLVTGKLPTDRALAGPDMARVADLVRASDRCTFAADNAGIVHLLSGMPPCSRFLFGAYIARDQQQSIIAELAAARPEIILWDSTAWWAHIDDRDLHDRAPILAAWIEANFPVRTEIGSNILLSRHDLPPP